MLPVGRAALLLAFLAGGVENVPNYRGRKVAGRFPFDAQVWLKLEHCVLSTLRLGTTRPPSRGPR